MAESAATAGPADAAATGRKTADAAVVHLAVARHARETPGAPALVHRGQTTNYRSLHAASRSYAARLAALGVGPGQTVPLLMPRSPELVAVQLAVMACGAAYAGIDPRWPAQRLRDVLDTTATRVVVTAGSAPPPGPAQLLTVAPRDLERAAADPAPAAPEPAADPAAPAMVVFTSGTTGRPKGVVLPHRAVTRIFRATPPPGFGRGNAMPQGAPPWWDMYGFELFGQLMTGGTSLLNDSDYLLPATVRALAAAHAVTTLRLTTTLFHLFVDEDPDCFAGLSQVFVGGEPMSPQHAQAFLARHPGIRLVNGYGPAESCMHATYHQVRPEDCANGEPIPLGTPVPFTRIAVIGPDGQPCAPGEQGEIHISGEGLADGYLGDPEQTAGSFVMLADTAGAVRAYRTGDLGFLDADGLLHFRGRADRQLKIHGHRVEAAEIETAARGVPGIRDCAVVPVTAADDSVSGTALFYLPTEGATAGTDGEADPDGDPLGLAPQLARLLPDHLVPGRVAVLDAFPLTPNGKLDRPALAELARQPVRRQRPRPAAAASGAQA